MKRLITNFAIIFLIVFSLLTIACPTQSIQRAKDSSAKLAGYANTGVNLTRDLYEQNLINLATKDKIADAFIVLAKAGIAFDAAVAQVEAQYGASAVPKSEIDKLFAVFSSEVVAKFLDVVAALKLTNQANLYAQAIDLIKTAVLIIAKAFGRSASVKQQLAVKGG
jgi:hypothetical protein